MPEPSLRKKASTIKTAIRLEQIPNVGPSLADDLRLVGVKTPSELKAKDPYKLYTDLCRITKTYHDPCVLDVFISAVEFAKGKKAKPWWDYTALRKKSFSKVEDKISKWRNKK